MTVFVLKIIAVIAMLIDHTGFMLAVTGTAAPETIEMMRQIGRIAFPIYAFLIVNGWKYTRNKKNYINNMIIFAAISHIPFSLAIGSYIEAGTRITERLAKWTLKMDLNGESIAFIFIMTAAYIYFIWKERKDWTIIPAVLAFTFPFVIIKGIGSSYIMLPALSIFYTLTLGMLVITIFDRIMEILRHRKKLILIEDFSKYVAETVAIIAVTSYAIYMIIDNIDYSGFGITLVIGLHILKRMRITQAAFIALWAYELYYLGQDNIKMALFATIAVIPILFYNEKKGPGFKYLFYAFYPAHLLILGICAVYIMNYTGNI